MRRYLDTARRYRWVILAVLALTWGSGGALAIIEYTTSYEADATIWTERQSQQFAPISPMDPGLTSFITPAAEQAGVLMQLLQTRTFLSEIVRRTSYPRPPDTDERKFLADISKRFQVEVLGTNLFRLSFRARDPRTGPQMVIAALELRQEHLATTRLNATTTAATFYRSELDVVQNKALEAQRELDRFDDSHKPPFSPPDEYQQRQLRLAVEDTKARVSEMKLRIDRSTVLPDILQLADSLDFQVFDRPLDEVKPTGGLRAAGLIGGTALVAGLALVALLVLGGTLLAGGITGEADVARLAPATLFATVPEAGRGKGGPDRELRAALATATFASPPNRHPEERDA
jgi:uncharacterized protein involved in exopolysaccharide biosynthesis